MAQYAAKFLELARYAPQLILDEAAKADKFEKGLRPVIMKQVAGFELKDYNKLVDKAFKIEATLILTEQLKNKRNNEDNVNNNKRGPPNKGQGGQDQPQRKQRTEGDYKLVIKCSCCGRNHDVSECQEKSGACFGCGEIGHLRRNCPRTTQQTPQQQLEQNATNNNSQRPLTTGRVFTLNSQGVGVINEGTSVA